LILTQIASIDPWGSGMTQSTLVVSGSKVNITQYQRYIWRTGEASFLTALDWIEVGF